VCQRLSQAASRRTAKIEKDIVLKSKSDMPAAGFEIRYRFAAGDELSPAASMSYERLSII
jgi:hypothetical protein